MPNLPAQHIPAADVHLWRIPLEASSVPCESGERALTAEERARAARFRFPADRARWVRTRSVVRALLGRYLKCPPAEVPLVVGTYGKPVLLPGFRARPLHFNWSHAEDAALLAVTEGGPVGVDIERLRADFDPLPLAQSVFSPNELACLCAAPPAKRLALFFAFWTGKEAILKALGTGLSLPPAGFCIAGLAQEGTAHAHGFSVRALHVGAFHAAALAFSGKDPSICRHDWHD